MAYFNDHQKNRFSKKTCAYEEYQKLMILKTNAIQPKFLTELIDDMQRQTAVIVYLLISSLAANPEIKKHTVIMSYREIASLIKTSTRTAIRTIKYLKNKGYIEVVRSGNRKEGYSSNKIKVRFPRHLLNKIFDSNQKFMVTNNLLHEDGNEQK